jgi:adenine deaminase
MLNNFCKKPLWEVSRVLAEVAQGGVPAATVIRNVRLVNVCTHEVQEGVDVAIAEGRIAYVGDAGHCIGEGTTVVDAGGAYLAPGFLDGHIHVESSMLGVGEYARAVLPHGTTGIYMDPHEICNVLGLDGVRLMAADGARTPLKAMITTPSCVPAVPGFEDTGAAIGPDEIAESMQWPSVVGLGEMMNFVGVLAGTEHAHGEVGATLRADKVVTGHYSMPEHDRGLNAYIASGVRCCHESTRAEDALAKMRLGMYAMLREGSAWHDLHEVVRAITEANPPIDTRFACLISDDTHPHTLVANGHIDHLLRRAVAEGLDAVTAIQMVTLNVATCFRMDNELGSVTPGKCADLVRLRDLQGFEVLRTWVDGDLVAEDGAIAFELEPFAYPEWATHSMHVGTTITPATFKIDATARGVAAGADTCEVRAIEIIPERVGTFEARVELPVVDGCIEGDAAGDVLKTFVFERHRDTGSFGVGFTKGFGIRRGALASTVAHDAHNLLVMGASDEDMALAANTLIGCGGGMVAVRDGEVLGVLPLPIAGLMDDRGAAEMSGRVAALDDAWKEMGCTIEAPFMTMALIPLACLPELRLTNRGLVDCRTFEFTDLVY